MEQQSYLVVWRGQKFVVEMNPTASLKELGEKLQELTNVKADTLRLLVPLEKSSKLLYPFSDEHSFLSLDSITILKGNSIRMMGVPKDEVDEVLQNANANLRIAGFDEEEKRLKQRHLHGSYTLPKLPLGTYIFCDFRTLSLPGIELNPPASKALELLHKLASDPGIVAILNKHHWRVGILTEMAPIGYVGVSPKCILGVNKNHGEEISLRLRTDDLKGFRKYQSIKKTLLHELAHMVFSEHDSNFYALDKQLNEEAATLDWTKSRGHTLSGVAHSQRCDDGFGISSNATTQKLGGQASFLCNARAASVNAAVERLANSSTTVSRSSEVEWIESEDTDGVQELTVLPTPAVHGNHNVPELDPDGSKDSKTMLVEPYVESEGNHVNIEMDPHHIEGSLPASETQRCGQSNTDNARASPIGSNSNSEVRGEVAILERKLDDSGEDSNRVRFQNRVQPNRMGFLKPASTELTSHVNSPADEPQPSDSHAVEMQSEPDSVEAMPKSQTVEPDPDDPELQIIQDPVTMFYSRLQSAIHSLKFEVKPSETGMVLQTLTKIIRNVIEHPEDMKFKKLRKANPMIQRNIIAHKAAMDILTLIGFCEDVIVDEWGKTEVFLMLKRNDPGLLWLAKSSLEKHVV